MAWLAVAVDLVIAAPSLTEVGVPFTPAWRSPSPPDAALAALVRASWAAEIDSAYAAYDDRPLDDADEWGRPRVVP